MLKPKRHAHPDQTVINMACLVLAKLRDQRVAGLDELVKFSKKRVIGGKELLAPALNLLFLLGLIEYRPKADTIEYVGP
ncbi:MAG: hypothetical protein LBF38_02540 [Deltaproteobacteria bacterium]|nr:hypothetical protein [Deltaproteobacteria bacterium]